MALSRSLITTSAIVSIFMALSATESLAATKATDNSNIQTISQMNEDKKFEDIYKEEWDWRQSLWTDSEDSGKDEIASHLPDVSLKQQVNKQSKWEDTLEKLKSVNYDNLSDKNKINYLVYKNQIEVLINAQRYKVYEKPLSGDTAFWSDLAYTARRDFKNKQDYEKYISQLNDFPRYFEQNVENMRAGLKRKFTPPQVSLIGRDSTLAAIVDTKNIEDNLYFKPFTKFPSTISEADKKILIEKGKAAISQKVIPAHAMVLKFFRQEYFPNAQKSIAAYNLPDGKAFYQAQIKEYTTVDMSADEIHEFGLKEVAKIHAEMEDVIKEVNFKGSFEEFLNFLKTDPQFYVTNPKDLLYTAAWIAKEFDGKAKNYFGRLPRSRFAIIPAPDDVAPFYTSGRGGPGVYIVNTYNLPARPLYAMPALTLHESAPGHAFQMPLALENKELPDFRRNYYISAYGEGWALYCERLGDEMGMFHSPYDRFGMLSYQMWRAARLVVDTGIHAKGWTREQAQKYLKDNTALADHEITTEVDRYIAWPGQALSYYIGENKIWELRHKSEKALGEKFDIRQFHDTVLEMGSVPLGVLETRIDKFIQDGGKGPYYADSIND